MIKRYGLGPKRLGGIADTSVYGPDIVEMKDGDYVRYDDYIEIIDAIGAGGVNGVRLISKEPGPELIEQIKALADIRLVDGRAELANVRVLIHAITRGITRSCAQSRDKLEVQ